MPPGLLEKDERRNGICHLNHPSRSALRAPLLLAACTASLPPTCFPLTNTFGTVVCPQKRRKKSGEQRRVPHIANVSSVSEKTHGLHRRVNACLFRDRCCSVSCTFMEYIASCGAVGWKGERNHHSERRVDYAPDQQKLRTIYRAFLKPIFCCNMCSIWPENSTSCTGSCGLSSRTKRDTPKRGAPHY